MSEGRRRAEGPRVDYEPGTLVDLYLEGLERHAHEEAKLTRRPDGAWESHGYEAVGDRVRDAALGLRRLGFERGDRLAIVAGTRMEWALADFALIMAGVVSVPVYPSLPADQMQYILENAGVRAAFVEDQEQYDKVVEVADGLPELESAIAFEPVEAADRGPSLLSLEELEGRGREAGPELRADYESHARRAAPGDLATLIYTSGTTGAPKGVMLTQNNFYSNVLFSLEVLPSGAQDVSLSWLPLSHVFERMAGHYLMWIQGVTVAYAGSVDTVARDMGEVRPTIMTAVPRLYEKVVERAEAAAREGGAAKEKIFAWARRVGEARAEKTLHGERPGALLNLRYALADLLVFQKLRDRTGGRIRYFISGGAPLPPAIGKFFWAAGLPVLEGYGLTETSPVLAVNPAERPKLGTVGPPIANTELRIADDGEILARGPQVMKGYYDDPEATSETLTADGWIHTGDVGELDADGYLRITDRKKELLVTSVGKNIAPSPVEQSIQRSRFVEHAVLVGDGRRFPVVLIQPAYAVLEKWAESEGLPSGDRKALLGEARVRRLYREEVSERVHEFAHHEQPGRVLLVPHVFGVDTGELTPTMKVKRRVVTDRYSEDLDRVYREADDEGETGREVEVAEAR